MTQISAPVPCRFDSNAMAPQEEHTQALDQLQKEINLTVSTGYVNKTSSTTDFVRSSRMSEDCSQPPVKAIDRVSPHMHHDSNDSFPLRWTAFTMLSIDSRMIW